MGPCLPEERKANRRNLTGYKTGQPRPEKEGLGGPETRETVSTCRAIVGKEDAGVREGRTGRESQLPRNGHLELEAASGLSRK